MDPGCGPGSLTAAFVEEAISRGCLNSVSGRLYEIDSNLANFAKETLTICEELSASLGVKWNAELLLEDFVIHSALNSGLFNKEEFTHVIANPPYKKISTKSDHRKALRSAYIETVNLFAGFIALAIQKLKKGGELVAIVPRSFCNGPYYLPFRRQILRETSLVHLHIFDSRNWAFSDDEVLQENIILHLIKGEEQEMVTITSSPIADFHYDEESKSTVASDMTRRIVSIEQIVNPDDPQCFFHIAANDRDQRIIDKLSAFNATLMDIGLEVSTGPVIDFRLKNDLRKVLEPNSAPLLYPIHLNEEISWPLESKKPNAIQISERSRPWLWNNSGSFVLTKRFTSKEEKRRIVAAVYDGSLPRELIGFENKLNVFHCNKEGIGNELAIGLSVFLNSSLLDQYYRLFGGHTQVNATDLRSFHYPTEKFLCRVGRRAGTRTLNQQEIDQLLEDEMVNMTGDATNPLSAQNKVGDALSILEQLGMPRPQRNERSALTLLALVNLHPTDEWTELKSPLLGETPIMDWIRDVYGKTYAPNTRETIRRQTLHQFVDGGICLYNPDKPDRPVNSPQACYQIAPDLYKALRTFGSDDWDSYLKKWLEDRQTLIEHYAMMREMKLVPLRLDDGSEIHLSPGEHSQLIHDIVTDFGPRFVPGAEVIYLGDTGAKNDFFKPDRLSELGVTVDRKGKLPDVVLYMESRDWLVLIESVKSHGPVDGKRHNELSTLFSSAKPGLVYVTAFPNRKAMAKYLSEISWETEVWTADAPSHMIHFDGDKFFGPHS